jgi:hypothetical protein
MKNYTRNPLSIDNSGWLYAISTRLLCDKINAKNLRMVFEMFMDYFYNPGVDLSDPIFYKFIINNPFARSLLYNRSFYGILNHKIQSWSTYDLFDLIKQISIIVQIKKSNCKNFHPDSLNKILVPKNIEIDNTICKTLYKRLFVSSDLVEYFNRLTNEYAQLRGRYMMPSTSYELCEYIGKRIAPVLAFIPTCLINIFEIDKFHDKPKDIDFDLYLSICIYSGIIKQHSFNSMIDYCIREKLSVSLVCLMRKYRSKITYEFIKNIDMNTKYLKDNLDIFMRFVKK